MELIVITPPTDIENEIAFVNEILEKGLDRLHLRKENSGIDVYRNYLNKMPAVFHAKVAVHDYPELIKEFPAIGFHCKTSVWNDEKKLKEVLSLSSSLTMSASFHSWDDVLQAPYDFNYVFISPVFDSIFKPGYTSSIDIAKLKAVKQDLINKQKKVLKIYALGGIDAIKIPALGNAGFDGVAVLGTIWQSDDCLAAFETMHRLIKGWQ